MTPSYFNFQPSLLIDLNEDQVIPHDYDQQHHTLKLHHASSSSSSSSSPPPCPFFFSSSQGQAGYHFMGSHGSSNHQEVDNFSTCGEGSLRCHRVEETKMECNGLKFSIRKKEEHSENGSASVKWMSSKMRLMKTTTIKPEQMNGAKTSMIGENTFKYYEDHKQPSSSPMDISSSNNNTSATIRVCADCNTTKTPLWRSGPRGPKSLCNACGIRQRKARRAMAAAASGTILGTKTPTMKSSSKVQHEEIKRSSTGFGLQQKKRTKATSNPSRNQKKLCFEEFALNLTKKLSLIHQVFPQEEKEAAILLMALSYGLVHG